MTYEIHPLAACWGKPANYEEIKESIKTNGLRDPISLYQGKIIEGVQRYNICGELGIEPRFETPQIEDPFVFVLDKNKHRRHATKSQLAMAVAGMANIQNGSNRYRQKSRSAVTAELLKTRQVAEKAGVSARTISSAKAIYKHGNEDLINEVKSGRMCVDIAEDIALGRPSPAKSPRPEDNPKAEDKAKAERQSGHGRVFYWKEWKTKEPEQIKRLFAPSIYPLDAKVPVGNTGDEQFVRDSINRLRKNEEAIPSMKIKELDYLIYPDTQRIQTYVINRLNIPRPEGNLDKRFWDWAQAVAKKMVIMQNFYRFLDLQKEKDRAEKDDRELEKRPRLSPFDKHFNDLWNAQSKYLRFFNLSDLPRLKERWLAKVDHNFQLRANRSKAEKIGNANGSRKEK